MKMLTLTLLHSDDPLRQQCHRIKEAFRRLRATAVWRDLVRGGFWVIEITRNIDEGQWHVHIHAIIDCKYLPHDWIKRNWLRITGDSYIVHITAITPDRSAYVAKYTSKGSSISDDSEGLWQYYEAMDRCRDAQPFGTCGPLSEEDPTPRGKCTYCGSVSTIISAANGGLTWAIELLPVLHEGLARCPSAIPSCPSPMPSPN